MGTSLKGKNSLPEGANSFLYEKSLWYEKRYNHAHLVISIECEQFSTQVRNCIMGAKPMINLAKACTIGRKSRLI